MKYSPVDAQLRAYLFGELAEAERDAMETDIFADKETFYRLSEIEDRLIDDYARGYLSGQDKLKFEQLYLSNPARCQRVEFALTMTSELDRQPGSSPAAANTETAVAAINDKNQAEGRSWWFGFLESLREPKLAWAVATASVVLLISGGAWLMAERARLQAQLTQARLANEVAIQRQRELESQLSEAQIRNNSQLAAGSPTPTPSGKPSISASAVFAYTLNIFSLRGETGAPENRISLPVGTEILQLRLPLARQDFPRYQLSLRDGRNRMVFASRNLRSVNGTTDAALMVVIPARQLPDGDYLLTLEGIIASGEIEPVGKKQFKIERQ